MGKRKPRADGLYQVKVYLGKVDGKPKYKYLYGATEKEVEEKANDVRARMKKGLDVSADLESFSVWSKRWLRIKKADVGPGQYQNYKSCLKRLAPLDGVPISKVTAYDIQQIITDLSIENPMTERPTAKKTLNDIKNTARQVLQLAVENRIIDYNPGDAVRVPKNAPKGERRALTEVEQGWIVKTPHRMQTAAMLMMYAGLRRGELIPLLWDDINLEACTISVNKSVDLSRGKPVLKPGAKTKAGRRVIDIPTKLANYLLGIERSNNLVCPSLSDTMYTADSWRTSWDSYLLDLDILYGDSKKTLKEKYREEYKDKEIKRNNKFNPRFQGVSIEPITPHMLRHTFCTMLYFAGVDVLTAQQQMGHTDATTTLGIYTHLDTSHKRRQMSKLNEYLSVGVEMGVANNAQPM